MKMSKIFSTAFIQPIYKNPKFDFRSFYCDFETILVEGVHYVSCFSIVGDRVKYYKSLGFVDKLNIKYKSAQLVVEFIEICNELKRNLFLTVKSKVLFFFHNFNKFDSFFIINALTKEKEYNIELITRNRTIYKMIVTSLKNNLNLEFRDSYLLLNMDLKKIGNVFCKKSKKLDFDFKLHTLEIYQKRKLFSNVRKALKIYCLNDSLTLKEGFEYFIILISGIVEFQPLLCLSLPSLGIRYFLSNYYDLKNKAIENCFGNIEKFIRKSYKGGVVDIFKPHMKNGYHYDINSLYPYVMKEFEYPVGAGTFVNSVDINLNSFFGFLEVEVYCPSSIKIPLLTKFDKSKGLVCPIGRWTDVYFSEELKVAQSLGYEFKILRGVSYAKEKIFAGIIGRLHSMRTQFLSNSPINMIIKLLMNSLYGRFGMKPFVPVTQIVDEKEYNEIQAVYEVLDQIVLNTKIVVVFIKKPVLEKLDLLLNSNLITKEKYNFFKNESLKKPSFTPVQIASAITSYARIIIYQYKLSLENTIYYSDTDSIFCKIPINNRFLSDYKLGFMKKCGKIKEAFFVAPKIYACMYSNSLDIKCKGVNKGLVSFEDIKDLYLGQVKSYINILLFKKDYKKFIIKKIEQKIDISGIFLKRNKIYKNGQWVSTQPHKY